MHQVAELWSCGFSALAELHMATQSWIHQAASFSHPLFQLTFSTVCLKQQSQRAPNDSAGWPQTPMQAFRTSSSSGGIGQRSDVGQHKRDILKKKTVRKKSGARSSVFSCGCEWFKTGHERKVKGASQKVTVISSPCQYLNWLHCWFWKGYDFALRSLTSLFMHKFTKTATPSALISRV